MLGFWRRAAAQRPCHGWCCGPTARGSTLQRNCPAHQATAAQLYESYSSSAQRMALHIKLALASQRPELKGDSDAVELGRSLDAAIRTHKALPSRRRREPSTRSPPGRFLHLLSSKNKNVYPIHSSDYRVFTLDDSHVCCLLFFSYLYEIQIFKFPTWCFRHTIVFTKEHEIIRYGGSCIWHSRQFKNIENVQMFYVGPTRAAHWRINLGIYSSPEAHFHTEKIFMWLSFLKKYEFLKRVWKSMFQIMFLKMCFNLLVTQTRGRR